MLYIILRLTCIVSFFDAVEVSEHVPDQSNIVFFLNTLDVQTIYRFVSRSEIVELRVNARRLAY